MLCMPRADSRPLIADGDRPLSRIVGALPAYVATPELRLEVPEDVKFPLVERAVRYFSNRYDVVAVDGVRVQFGDGWGLIRASNTQPVIVARFEASSAKRPAADPGDDGGLAAPGGGAHLR